LTWGFKKQLRAGEVGEIIFLAAQREDMIKLKDFKTDFKSVKSGETYELKSDYYGLDATPNFFFERYSDEAKGTPGGPWRSLEEGATYFVYFVVPSLTYFKFKTKELVEALEPLIKDIKPFSVPNKSWTTIGYRVPRSAVEHLAEVYDVSVSSKKRRKRASN
jgi:hypothetical protein